MTDQDVVEIEEEAAAPRGLPRINPFNLLSGCVLLLTLLVCGCATMTYFNPYNPLNPYQPPPPRPPAGTATAATVQASARPPVETREPAATPTPTLEPPPIATPTPAVSNTPAPTVVARFMAEISASKQTLSGRTCEDNSIAGEVKDGGNNPLIGYTVEVSRDDGFRRSVISGSRPEYGPAGWEVLLVNDQGTPEPLHLEYRIRLFDPMGVEVANPIEPGSQTRTSNNCDEGVIYIVFIGTSGGQ